MNNGERTQLLRSEMTTFPSLCRHLPINPSKCHIQLLALMVGGGRGLRGGWASCSVYGTRPICWTTDQRERDAGSRRSLADVVVSGWGMLGWWGEWGRGGGGSLPPLT